MAKLEIGKNDLQTCFPDIAKEWHPTKNGYLTPKDVLPGSNKKVWWQCPLGHEYESMIAKRTSRGQGCPYCANQRILVGFNDMATTHREVLPSWDFEKNIELKPDSVFAGSDKKAWWRCDKGHSYQMRIANKTKGAGCPICSHQKISEETSLASVNPDIAKEWHPTKNGNLTPYDVMPSAHKKVWWLCPFGHEYQTVVYARQRTGCPICDSEKRTSFPEQAMTYYLGKLFPVESRCILGGFEADIYCPMHKFAIEYDGEYFHAGDDSYNREERKNRFFIENGILLFRVKERKHTIGFDCRETEYGFEIETKYSQDYNFIKRVVETIVNEINTRYQKMYSVDIDVDRDKVGIISLYAQQKDNNSFLKQKPLGALKWNRDKNGDIDLGLLPRTSKKKYWWKCPTCGYEWYGTLDNVVNSLTCKKCSRQVNTEYDVAPEIMMDKTAVFRDIPNSLQTQNPDLAAQWHPTKNGYFKPSHVTPKSGKRVWWLCPDCGNEWTQIIKTRNDGNTARKCPVCANNQKKSRSEGAEEFNRILYKEWHPTKNGGRKLNDYSTGSSVKVWWVCSECGTEYCCPIKSRKNGGGCPTCGRNRTVDAKKKKVRNINTNEVFESVKSAAQSCEIHPSSITNCLNGRTKTAGGYKWEYYEDTV